MSQSTLLVSQKNQILELIKNTSFDPFNFEWSEVYSSFSNTRNKLTVSEISYKNSNFYYVFDFKNDKNYSIFSPGKDQLNGQEYPGNWEHQMQYFVKWLSYLEREVSQPDQWEVLEKQKLEWANKFEPDSSNEQFTFPQVQQIENGLTKIKEYLIKEKGNDKFAEEIINKKLDYLIDAAKRQGKNDWFHTCIGVFSGISVALSLSPEQTHNIYISLKSTFSGILKLLPF